MSINKVFFNIKKLRPNVKIPTLGSPGAAGYDIYADSDFYVPEITVDGSIDNGFNVNIGQMLHKCGFSVQIPKEYYLRIAPRSGLALKGIDIGGGVIDSDYRGEVGVILYNLNQFNYSFKKGERIAQMILTKIETPEITVVDDLDSTEREQGGFGSTGK